ncbi:hypothetical protein F5146DRAFT_1004841 [Armillaria mellea]|nr:hypothetical protein F5146DRAFT_1004841 [Armillaria mellea]
MNESGRIPWDIPVGNSIRRRLFEFIHVDDKTGNIRSSQKEFREVRAPTYTWTHKIRDLDIGNQTRYSYLFTANMKLGHTRWEMIDLQDENPQAGYQRQAGGQICPDSRLKLKLHNGHLTRLDLSVFRGHTFITAFEGNPIESRLILTHLSVTETGLRQRWTVRKRITRRVYHNGRACIFLGFIYLDQAPSLKRRNSPEYLPVLASNIWYRVHIYRRVGVAPRLELFLH